MEADNLQISKIFSSGGDIHYVLPHFQREYTWDKTHWETLLNDAISVYEEANKIGDDGFSSVEHFLGSIVVIHDGMRSGTISAFKLVDGQQRLTTISLLLKALSKRVETTHAHITKKIQKLLVNSDEVGDLFFKILPTVKYRDRDSYCAVIKETEFPDNNSKIVAAYRFFENELALKISEGFDPERLFQIIVNSFQVVFINLNQKESPYRIFESLNAKGKPLTQADLVRNYIAMRLPASHQERVFIEAWGRLEELLREDRDVGRLPELTAFLRHYLAMRTGMLCDEGHVYARFRDRFEKQHSDVTCFEKELYEIYRYSVYYDKILRPEKFEDDDIATAISRLNALEALTAYPFLLHMLDSYGDARLTRTSFLEGLECLENYMVRRYVCGEVQSYLNRMYPSLWKEIDKQNFVPSLKETLAHRHYPSNARVFRDLRTRRLYDNSEKNRRRTLLILQTINRRLSKGSGGYTVLDAAPSIEHIMPQTLDEKWKLELGSMWEQIYHDQLHTLGNLTLVTSEWNSGLSNSLFSIKRTKLSENALVLNNEYFSQDIPKWGRDEIFERSEMLGELIIEIWPSFVTGDEEDAALKKEVLHALEFDFKAIELIARHLGVGLRRISQARFETTDGKQRVVGLCSKPYGRPNETKRYWYGIRPSQKQFLEWAGTSWIAFECESAEKVVLIPFAEFQPLLNALRETEGRHWHVDLVEQAERIELPLPLRDKTIDVTKYLLSTKKT